jgi:hypothetical protein
MAELILPALPDVISARGLVNGTPHILGLDSDEAGLDHHINKLLSKFTARCSGLTSDG